jgi:hypothetical protein
LLNLLLLNLVLIVEFLQLQLRLRLLLHLLQFHLDFLEEDLLEVYYLILQLHKIFVTLLLLILLVDQKNNDHQLHHLLM